MKSRCLLLACLLLAACPSSQSPWSSSKDTKGAQDGFVTPFDGTTSGEDSTTAFDPGTPGEDTFLPDPGGADSTVIQDPGGPEDPGPHDPGPACPFTVSVTVDDGVSHIPVGGKARISWTAAGAGSGVTAQYALEIPVDGASLESDGTNAIVLGFDAAKADHTFHTTRIGVRVNVTDSGCTASKTAYVSVLGSVWATIYGKNVVKVMKSDKTPLTGAGIGSAHLLDPWCVAELPGNRLAVGNRHPTSPKMPVEMFDLEGNHLGSFESTDAGGTWMYGAGGGYAILYHPQTQKVWVGGANGAILLYDDQGHFQGNTPLSSTAWAAEAFGLLQDGTVVVAYGTASGPAGNWAVGVHRADGTYDHDLGVGESMGVKIEGLDVGPTGLIGLGGVTDIGNGVFTLVKPSGLVAAMSSPTSAAIPKYGVAAFGRDFLVATEGQYITKYKVGADGKPSTDTTWFNSEQAEWRGILVLGGN